jgi:hypothetical protein
VQTWKVPRERLFERRDIDVMQQGREPHPAFSRGCRAHTLKVRQQGKRPVSHAP